MADDEKEECEHNRPFWECEICGNQKLKTMPERDYKKAIEKVQNNLDDNIAKTTYTSLREMIRNLEKKVDDTHESLCEISQNHWKEISSLRDVIDMQYSDPVTYKGKYKPSRFEKWQTSQMNKDYLLFKETIKEQIPATKEEYLNLVLKCLKNRGILREHLKTHLEVSRKQIKGIDKDIIFIEFDEVTKELIEKLDAKDGDSKKDKEIKAWDRLVRKGLGLKEPPEDDRQTDCEYWDKGHKIMNCKNCKTPNQEYCKKFYEKESPEANYKDFVEHYEGYWKEKYDKLIGKFLKKIRHIPLFWVIGDEYLKEVYEAIDEIRDYYQKKLKEKK